jgi:hypothetical protein
MSAEISVGASGSLCHLQTLNKQFYACQHIFMSRHIIALQTLETHTAGTLTTSWN